MIIKPNRLITLLVVIFTLTSIKIAFGGFPASSGGGGFCFFACDPVTSGGSVIRLDTNPDNENGLAPVAVNFFEYADEDPSTVKGDLCVSGKVDASITGYIPPAGSGITATSGTATYEILSAAGDNKGMCYSNVEQTEKTSPGSSGEIGNCTYKTYVYSRVLPDTDSNANLASALNGKFRVDSTRPTDGAYDICDTLPDTNICDIEIGFGVYNNVPEFIGFKALFPAETTLSGETTEDGQVLFADEVRIECSLEDVGVKPSPAVDAKSAKIYLSETLAMNAYWCSDLQSDNPDCNAFNPDTGERTVGEWITAIGDFQLQNTEVTCVSSAADLLTLDACPTAIALAACPDGTGLIELTESFDTTSIENCAYQFTFTSPLGGGTRDANVIAYGSFFSPGYMGDSEVPAVSLYKTAIVDDPDVNDNYWNFDEVFSITDVSFIFGREGDDTIIGWLGDDNIIGDNGVDTLHGNAGDDILQGGANTDILYGDCGPNASPCNDEDPPEEEGNDLLLGYQCTGLDGLPRNGDCSNQGSDQDLLFGNGGNDCLDGGRGPDILNGGPGEDVFVLGNAFDSDIIEDFDGANDVIVSTSNTVTVTDNGDGTYSVAAKGKNDVTVHLVAGNPPELGINVFDNAGALSTFSQCSKHPESDAVLP